MRGTSTRCVTKQQYQQQHGGKHSMIIEMQRTEYVLCVRNAPVLVAVSQLELALALALAKRGLVITVNQQRRSMPERRTKDEGCTLTRQADHNLLPYVYKLHTRRLFQIHVLIQLSENENYTYT